MTNGIKVHILECGAMGTDIEWLLCSPKNRASRTDRHKPATWLSVATHAVLIEHPEGTILWDATPSRDWETEWAGSGLDEMAPYDQVEEHQYLDSRLRQLGYETGDIDQVILSHLHMDHAGGAKLFDNGHTRLVVNETELTEALAFDGFFSGGHIKRVYEGLTFDTVSGDVEIVPGVTLLETPGHTWGTMSLKVDLPNDGPMIFTSDAVYLEESLEQRHWGSAVWDNRAWLRSVDRLVAIAEKENATMVFGHDAAQMATLRHGPDAFYS
ncbi:N-acyl homoserine lactonase family protein [Microbacterium sp. LMC-P-041]|uniref:N-acyl homoserine lactonase family protein n=1 Tax=Microbacterium sp. LMC-P-041 TaxID=3040293 RepID=UPI002553CCA4|nr:N-acyl homoserine lactonase family protein [Microbacterium sp. LMC-P-041]